MKKTFIQFLTEARIVVPQTTHKEVMNVVVAAYFNYISQLMQQQGKKPDQAFLKAMRSARAKYGNFSLYDIGVDAQVSLQGTATYYVDELPDRYKSKNLKNSKIKIQAGNYGSEQDLRAEYYGKAKGIPGLIRVNVNAIPGVTDDPGDSTAILDDIEELQNIVDHELQHVTQDSVLRKLHPKQFIQPGDVQDPTNQEEYFLSPVEFQPQITTAVSEFKRSLAALKTRVDVTPAQLKGVLHSYLTGGEMPSGMLKWKPYFNSPFFRVLYSKDRQKWKKAVKDFNGLFSKSSDN